MSDINAVLEFDNEAKSALAELVEEGGGGGSSLPAVTADDNGKVLTVVNGEWDKAKSESQIRTYHYDITMNEQEEWVVTTPDATFEKISADIEAGKSVVAITTLGDMTGIVPLSGINTSAGSAVAFAFVSTVYNRGHATLFQLMHLYNDTYEFYVAGL